MTGGASSRLYCGVDLGASATKLVLVDAEGGVRGRALRHSGVDYAGTARACLAEGLAQAGAVESDVVATISTGYGRSNVDFADAKRTEIQCHGVGCYHHVPRAISIIDIGAQDNKVIHLDASGRRVSFRMNRKCAAGTGSFVEEIALRLGLDVGEMEPLARKASEGVRLGSFCTVFTKTEILAHLRQGRPVEGIVRGAFESVVARILEMDALGGEVVATGGVVAHNPTIARILADKLGRDVTVPPEPQFTGALGAALSALKQARET
jgi:predicted CoA-substrate-specific enzyme activase